MPPITDYFPTDAKIAAYRGQLQEALATNELTPEVRLVPGNRTRRLAHDARTAFRHVRATLTGRQFTPVMPSMPAVGSNDDCFHQIMARLDKQRISLEVMNALLGANLSELDHRTTIGMENRFLKLCKYERQFHRRFHRIPHANTDVRHYVQSLMQHYRASALEKSGKTVSNGDIEVALRNLVSNAFGAEMPGPNDLNARRKAIREMLDFEEQHARVFAAGGTSQQIEAKLRALRETFPLYEQEWPVVLGVIGERALVLKDPVQVVRGVIEQEKRLRDVPDGPRKDHMWVMHEEMLTDIRKQYAASPDEPEIRREVQAARAGVAEKVCARMREVALTNIVEAVDQYVRFARDAAHLARMTGIEEPQLERVRNVLTQLLQTLNQPVTVANFTDAFPILPNACQPDRFVLFLKHYALLRNALLDAWDGFGPEIGNQLLARLDNVARFIGTQYAQHAGPLGQENFFRFISPYARNWAESSATDVANFLLDCHALWSEVDAATPGGAASTVFDPVLAQIALAANFGWNDFAICEARFPAEPRARADAYLVSFDMEPNDFRSVLDATLIDVMLRGIATCVEELGDRFPSAYLDYIGRARLAVNQAAFGGAQ